MTNSPRSNSEPGISSFSLLHKEIQYWIWGKGWDALKDAQEQAIPTLIKGDRDVIISAATAAGKTEAAFLPILSRLLDQELNHATVLYVSPLKALINDQWGRLDSLCEHLDIPTTPWHGDISSGKKTKFFKNPRGIVLITPESLEALFVNRGHQISGLFANLQFVVIDEMHSFIDVERGKQLQSLLCRLEMSTGRWVPRVGLSATLGDMSLAAKFLRPDNAEAVLLIESKVAGQTLGIRLYGIEELAPTTWEAEAGQDEDYGEVAGGGIHRVAEMLFDTLRGTNNLVFPNRRSLVETVTDLLRRRCEQEGIPNEFWPHHGSLAKSVREETEEALKRGGHAATAICTSTLEMGIDIGSVKTVAQIGPPPSVASLRQRMGRSGRLPGEPAILRAYEVIEALDANLELVQGLRQELVRAIASIQLMLEKWCEPPREDSMHASTFVQQVLSLIAERGGAKATDLWNTLVEKGPFKAISRSSFVAILRELGEREILIQEASGLLLHGAVGEKLVNHYTFYAAFASPEEFRVVCEGRAIGNLSITNVLAKNSRIILAGRRWRVIEAYLSEKAVVVQPDPGGKPPAFDSGTATVHDRVRQQMRSVLSGNEPIKFLDLVAGKALDSARRVYRESHLEDRYVVQDGSTTYLFTWMGDGVNDALVLMLTHLGLKARNDGVAIEVDTNMSMVLKALEEIGGSTCSAREFLAGVEMPPVEKWDWCVPREVRVEGLLTGGLDFEGAVRWVRRVFDSP